ncbi:MAG: hypothetical protein ACQETL_19065 [Bacteroidota bacterium]
MIRKELIDFLNWYDSAHESIWILENEALVDEYLKSINEASNESLSVRDNEESKELCGHSSIHFHGSKEVYYCDQCRKTYIIKHNG